MVDANGGAAQVSPEFDSSILHEIVRVVDARARVPDRVRIRGREYQITYLDDHKQRIEEALRRRDTDRLSMLYGQLASKVKYQFLRRTPGRSTKAKAGSDGNRGSKRTASGGKGARSKKTGRASARAPLRGSKRQSSAASAARD